MSDTSETSSPATPAAPSKTGHYFKIENAIVDNGWARRLRRNEFAVLLIFMRFVDTHRGGVTFVGPEKISALTGIDQRNVQRATRKLVAYGILKTADPGGGRNRPCKRTVHFPETPADSASVSTGKPRRFSTGNPGRKCPETPANFDSKPRLNQPPDQDCIKTTYQNSSIKSEFAAVAAGGDFQSDEEEKRISDNEAFIGTIGVTGRNREQLARLPGANVERLQREFDSIGPGVDSVPAVFVSRVRDASVAGWPMPPKIETVTERKRREQAERIKQHFARG